MQDEFSALDFLSIGGFRLSSVPPEPPKSKPQRKFAVGSRKPKGGAKRGLARLFPFLAGRVSRRQRKLQGWPVPLSWPRHDVLSHEPWFDEANHLAN